MKYLIIFLFALAACTPQRRFDRLVKKYPYLLTSDTLIVKDTIRDTIRITVPEVEIDTVVDAYKLYDTITLYKDRIKVKVWRVKEQAERIELSRMTYLVIGRETKIAIEEVLRDRRLRKNKEIARETEREK